MRTEFGQDRLDEGSGSGVPLDSSPDLRERGRHLESRDSPLKMALGLARTLHQAAAPSFHIPQVPVRSQGLREAAPALEMLARRLWGSLPIAAQGAARTAILLSDRSGPLYKPGSGSDLKRAVLRALTAVDVDPGRRRQAAPTGKFNQGGDGVPPAATETKAD